MNNDALAANIRIYARKYQAASANGLTTQARFWLKRYEAAVKVLGFDPLA
jgi:hypothetical protein